MQIDPMQDAEPAENPTSEAQPAESLRHSPEGPWSLEALEADIAAVGSAMETVDRIVAGVTSGEGSVGSAAAEITAVVSHERFGTPSTDTPDGSLSPGVL